MYGAAVSWNSKLQTSPVLFSVETEYMAMTHAVQETIWIHQLLEDLGLK